MPKLLKHSILAPALVCLVALSANGQAGVLPLDTYQEHALERMHMQPDTTAAAAGRYHHQNAWPYMRRELPQADTAQGALPVWSPRFRKTSDGKWTWELRPLLDVAAGSSNESGVLYTGAGGFQAAVGYGEKLGLYVEIFGGVERLPAYVGRFVDSLGVLPGLGRNLADGQNAAYLMPTFALSYAPSKYFQIDAGFGAQRFGSGYRSMMLSDAAYNYPYLRITTDVWRFKYTNLFAAMTHVADEAVRSSDFAPKYMAAHHLSMALSKRITLSFFESIIWQGRDSLTERSFDPHYLNPVIFYRPVEFAMGSPDRVLIGADLSVTLGKKSKVYGQLVFDEFLLQYLRERSGWWANKWAVQAGATTFDPFGITGLRLQAEYNVARPFTYSHGSVVQNYAHFHQPLAHPLGSNFREALFMMHYERGLWYAESHSVVSQYGRDEGPNLGGDIFRSYVNPAFQFGNTIGQGLRHDVLLQRFTIGRIIDERLGLRVALRYTYRSEQVASQNGIVEHFFGLHLGTGFRNRYRDF